LPEFLDMPRTGHFRRGHLLVEEEDGQQGHGGEGEEDDHLPIIRERPGRHHRG
jgi:hypothetical protein